jgi:predicted Zn-dependent protease
MVKRKNSLISHAIQFLKKLTIFSCICYISSCTNNRQNVNEQVVSNIENRSEALPLLIQLYGGKCEYNSHIQKYVNQVFQRITKISNRPELDYELTIVQSFVPHFWTLSEGKCVIHQEFFYLMDNEAELAAIIAHGLAHMHLGHNQQILKEHLMQSITTPPPILPKNTSADLLFIPDKAKNEEFTPFYNRDQEKEAIKLTFEYLRRAGYDSNSLIYLQQKFLRLERKNLIWSHGFLQCHPFFLDHFTQNSSEMIAKDGYIGENHYLEGLKSLLCKKNVSQHLKFALTAIEGAKYQAALEEIELGLTEFPMEAQLHFIKGQILRELNDLKNSLASFDQTIRINSSFFGYHLERAHTLLKLGRKEEALQSLRISLKRFPTAKAYYLLGKIYWQERNFEESKKCLQKASLSKTHYGRKAKNKLKFLLFKNPYQF